MEDRERAVCGEAAAGGMAEGWQARGALEGSCDGLHDMMCVYSVVDGEVVELHVSVVGEDAPSSPAYNPSRD